MARAEKLAEKVKSLTSRVHELEAALASTSSAHPLLASTTNTDSLNLEDDDQNDEGVLSETIGSLSIGTDGQTKYHGESAGSEVRNILISSGQSWLNQGTVFSRSTPGI